MFPVHGPGPVTLSAPPSPLRPPQPSTLLTPAQIWCQVCSERQRYHFVLLLASLAPNSLSSLTDGLMTRSESVFKAGLPVALERVSCV